jgi:hypothetical protein
MKVHRCVLAVMVLVGTMMQADLAAAQYTPTPPPSEYLDPDGNNVGCVRAGYSNCGGFNSGEAARKTPPKPDVWGAVAMSPGAVAWGVAWNYKSEASAKTEALARCRKAKVGGTACQVIKTVADVCLAIVASNPEKVAVIGGPTGASNFAEGNGQLLCQRAGGKSCKVLESFCADGQKHVLQGQTVYGAGGNPIFVPQGASMAGRTTRR